MTQVKRGSDRPVSEKVFMTQVDKLTEDVKKAIEKTLSVQLAEITMEELKDALRNITEAAVDTGIASGGTVTTLEDDTKSWPVDGFVKLIVEVTAGTGEGQMRRIVSNTVDTLTVDPAFDVAPDVTSQYRIAFFGKMASDITHIGGAAQSAVDIAEKINQIHAALVTNKNAGVELFGTNQELGEVYTLIWDGVKTEEFTPVIPVSLKNVLVRVDNQSDKNISIEFQHKVGDAYIFYKDAEGESLTFSVSASEHSVFGVVQGFPRFDGGRIKISALEAPSDLLETDIQIQEV